MPSGKADVVCSSWLRTEARRRRSQPGNGDDRGAEWSRDGRGLYYLHNFDTPDAEIRFIGRERVRRVGNSQTDAPPD